MEGALEIKWGLVDGWVWIIKREETPLRLMKCLVETQ